MWRITFALLSAVMLTTTLAASVLADSHLPADTAATGATGPVTAVPRTGVGLMADQAQTGLLLGLVGLSCLFALLAVTTAWRQRA
jgi:hypothetical protein